MEPSSRFEELKISVPDGTSGVQEVSAVLGIPRWWPTGSRVGVVLAHGASQGMDDPLVEHLQRELTERRYLSLRFNFPFAEEGRRKADSMAVLRRCYRAAVATLARDPTAAPAHVFLGGKGLGAQVAAELASARVRVDGLFLLGYPLHPQGHAEKAQGDQLFRIVSPVVFVQGSRDRNCELDVLRRTLSRVGAPTALHVVEEAGREDDAVRDEVLSVVDAWIQKVLGA